MPVSPLQSLVIIQVASYSKGRQRPMPDTRTKTKAYINQNCCSKISCNQNEGAIALFPGFPSAPFQKSWGVGNKAKEAAHEHHIPYPTYLG